MQCLHTLTEFNLDCYAEEHPAYLAIADYNNTLICYWDLTYKQSFVNVWDLETGQRKVDFVLGIAHEFGLGKQGKVCIVNFQHLAWALDTETQKCIVPDPNCYICVKQPNPYCFAVCPTKKTLFATGCHIGKVGELEIWDYETCTRRLHYQFQGMALFAPRASSSLSERLHDNVTPLLFSPNGKFFVARFQQGKHSILQLWDLETGELMRLVDNLPGSLILYSLAIDSNGQILACGTREDKVCVWELTSDHIFHSFSGIAPCLMSSNGRVLIYCIDYAIII